MAMILQNLKMISDCCYLKKYHISYDDISRALEVCHNAKTSNILLFRKIFEKHRKKKKSWVSWASSYKSVEFGELPNAKLDDLFYRHNWIKELLMMQLI